MKHILPLIFLVITCITTNAQTQIAVKGGWNYSTARVYYDNSQQGISIKQPNSYVSGYNIALLLKVPFDGILHFSPFIAYSRRGYIYKPTYDSNSITKYENTIHYIDIVPAVSADFVVNKKTNNTIVLSVGPQIGFALAGTEKTTANGITTSKKMAFSIDANYGFVDLGLNTSIAYHFKKMFFEAGYQTGFANINNNSETDFRNIRNRCLSLSVGYYIK